MSVSHLRLRQSVLLRNLLDQTNWRIEQLIQPLFVVEGLKAPEGIPGLRGVLRDSIEGTLGQIEADLAQGLKHFILFAVPAKKQDVPDDFSFTQKAIREIKKRFGDELFLWVDTCLCSSTSSGHCCLWKGKNIDLDPTLEILAKAARAFAEAGADGISPSDMMDGRTKAIRQALDGGGFSWVPIMSYSTKMASQFYGPFRAAADSTPQFGDRKAYQLDVRARDVALEASKRCALEGADLLMVKPGLPCLDLIQPIADLTGKAVGAYHVSGEYAGLHFLAENGLLSFEGALLESWLTLRRGGARYIITYGARYAKQMGLGLV